MDKIYIPLIFVIGFLFCLSIDGKDISWYIKLKQIQPLKSSKQDVEKIFDKLKVVRNFEESGISFTFYETSEGKLTVQYSTGECSSRKEKIDLVDTFPYNVEKGIVLNVVFFPKEELEFSRFSIDKHYLNKKKDGHSPGWNYVDLKSGIEIGTIKGKVIHIKYFPKSDYDYLKCFKSEHA